VPIRATFSVYIKSQNYDEVVSALKGQEFEVKAEAVESETKTSNTKLIVCSRNAQSPAEALNYEAHIDSFKGIDHVIPMFDNVKEELRWYKKPIIPIAISSIITLLIVYQAIVNPPQPEDSVGILITIGIPTIVTFLTQLGYRYFAHEQII
jgi:hypothetical protein